LRTSGAELKAILEKTGRRLKAISGVDKLDLLNDITEQIKEQIGKRGRMHLRFSELNDLLMREGLAPQSTAKDAIQQLLQLRCAQLERLGSYSRTGVEETDKTFRQALMDIPHSEVNSCFAVDDALSTAYAATDDTTQWANSAREESLRASGQDLKVVLEKTGRRLKCLNGMDKLDLLNYIAEQIREKVETRGRMNLKFSELNELLTREGLTPQPNTKAAIRELLALRQRQIKRLGNYSGIELEEQDKTFSQALVLIPLAEVNDCFSAEDVFKAEVQPESVSRTSSRADSVSSPAAHLVPPVRILIGQAPAVDCGSDNAPCAV
jgi:DNA repair protein RadC